jgi:hypothetical protein
MIFSIPYPVARTIGRDDSFSAFFLLPLLQDGFMLWKRSWTGDDVFQQKKSSTARRKQALP